MPDLNEQLNAMMSEALSAKTDDVWERDTPLVEAQLDELTAFAEHYARCREGRFAIGDLVTPTRASTLRGHGQPYLVVEVLKKAVPNFTGERGAAAPYGEMLNVRMARFFKTGFVLYWVEAWQLEPWSVYQAGERR